MTFIIFRLATSSVIHGCVNMLVNDIAFVMQTKTPSAGDPLVKRPENHTKDTHILGRRQ
jgi:hypothetical protein